MDAMLSGDVWFYLGEQSRSAAYGVGRHGRANVGRAVVVCSSRVGGHAGLGRDGWDASGDAV